MTELLAVTELLNVLENGEWTTEPPGSDRVYLCPECSEGHGEPVHHYFDD